ncbi:class I SAM-dependent methyltransferase [Cetobacterium somerae]|uniref:class I SAM-dependent methyltransferase n=1 Tax=Cetobacterium somerae TaxID=188913 RepID=UPI00225C1F10|nr:class I SAM-dependent methyltransferase [Cetobacterium somerae]MCX3067129.1 class I SAM-dependent methyltransferase [Cetobacterium somerae]
MSLKTEYENQQKYRKWSLIVDKLPIKSDHVVAELGCGTGNFAEVLSKKIKEVIAIDLNQNLLEILQNKKILNITILQKDISNLNYIPKQVDGIFSSFAIAYFPNKMEQILKNWFDKLKNGGWVAIIEIDDLLRGHTPLSKETLNKLEVFEDKTRNNGIYDFRAGRKISLILKDLGMEILLDEDLEDSELTDSGILSDEIYTMWENRLNRLSFDKFFQKNEIESIKADFLSLLKSAKHINQTKVKFIIAKKS